MSTHHSTVTFSGQGMAFEADINGHKFIIDTATDDGGNNSGPSPKKLMLVALGGCTAVDIVSILRKMKVPFSDFSVDTEGDLSSEHPKIYDHARIVYRIKLAESDRDKMEKAVALSKDKYCGVSAMFNKFAEVSFRIEYL